MINMKKECKKAIKKLNQEILIIKDDIQKETDQLLNISNKGSRFKTRKSPAYIQLKHKIDEDILKQNNKEHELSEKLNQCL